MVETGIHSGIRRTGSGRIWSNWVRPNWVRPTCARPTWAALYCVGLSGLLAGCGGTTVKDVVQLSAPRIAVLQSANAHGDSAEISIQIGQAKPMVLRAHVSARIEAAWVVGNHRLALIAGSTKDCPRQETLLIAQDDTGQLRSLGKCLDRFMVTLVGEQWSARLITARAASLRDPVNWVFQNGTLSGSATQSNLGARRGRAQPPDRAAESERGAEPERGPNAEPPPDADRAGGPSPEPPAPRNPMHPPPISRPVGDDVVPPPVGAGPLPGRPVQSPRLF